MKINNIDISNFKAKLMDRNIKSANFEIVNYWLNSSLNPYINEKYKYNYKELSFILDIICNDATELETMKSNIIKQLAIATIKFDDIDYYYRGFTSDTPVSQYIMRGNETLEVTMLVIAEKTEIIESVNRASSKTINVQGNLETPAIVEITPSVDIIDITITGLADDFITIKNLKQGQKVIINGEDCTVLQNGVNKFGDTDFWEFPKLVPGANTITFSKNSCDINIKYKPRYL